jgi:hypothetical protein
VDCFILERNPSGPLGKDHHVVGSCVRSCSGCREACSIGFNDCDDSGQVDGIFRRFLESFGVWLDWVCRLSGHLGRSRTSFGLKRIVGWASKHSVIEGFVYGLVLGGWALCPTSRRP